MQSIFVVMEQERIDFPHLDPGYLTSSKRHPDFMARFPSLGTFNSVVTSGGSPLSLIRPIRWVLIVASGG